MGQPSDGNIGLCWSCQQHMSQTLGDMRLQIEIEHGKDWIDSLATTSMNQASLWAA